MSVIISSARGQTRFIRGVDAPLHVGTLVSMPRVPLKAASEAASPRPVGILSWWTEEVKDNLGLLTKQNYLHEANLAYMEETPPPNWKI